MNTKSDHQDISDGFDMTIGLRNTFQIPPRLMPIWIGKPVWFCHRAGRSVPANEGGYEDETQTHTSLPQLRLAP